jgi:starch synthase
MAGADIFLIASRYEPCGLEQLYALKYGAVPVVRSTGGLDDTIIDYTQNREEGTGFKFSDYSSEALVEALARAISQYLDRGAWEKLMRRGMAQDFSWTRSAAQYEELYQRALARAGQYK